MKPWRSTLILLAAFLVPGVAGAQIATVPTDPAGHPAAACAYLNSSTNKWIACGDAAPLPVTGGVTPAADAAVVFRRASGAVGPFNTNAAVTWLTDYTALGLVAGTVYQSTDRGLSWSSLAVLANMTNAGGLACQGNICLAVGTSNDATDSVWRSANSGISWSKIVVNAAGSQTNAVGISGTTAVLNGSTGAYRSTDSGATWAAAVGIAGVSGVNGVAVKLGTVWLMPAGGNLFRSTNDGANWTNVLAGGGGQLNVVAASSSVAFANNGGSSVSKSTDTGATWTNVFTAGAAPKGVQAVNANVILTFVTGGLIYRSLDQGSTWAAAANIPNGVTYGGAVIVQSAVNAFGEVLVADNPNEVAVSVFSYYRVVRPGESKVVGNSGIAPDVTTAQALKVDGTGGTFPVTGTVTANQGTANAASNAWPTKVTDGTNTAKVQPASTPPAAADPALTVSLSPNGSTVTQGAVAASNAAWPVSLPPQSSPCKTTKANNVNAGADITVDATAGGVTVLAASTTRCGAVIFNVGAADMKCASDVTVTSTVGFTIPSGQWVRLDREGQQAYKCIRITATSTTASVIEESP